MTITPPKVPTYRIEHPTFDHSRVVNPDTNEVLGEAKRDEDIWRIDAADPHTDRNIAAWVDNRDMALTWLRYIGHHRIHEGAVPTNGHEL